MTITTNDDGHTSTRRPRTLIRRLLATLALVTVATTAMVVSTIPSASAAATAPTRADFDWGMPGCVNRAGYDGDAILNQLGGGARVCSTGSTRVFHATGYATVGLNVTVKLWTPLNSYQWSKPITTQSTNYTATCNPGYNPAILVVDNWDCGQPTYWHGPYNCFYAAGTVCGYINPNANAGFDIVGGLPAGSVYSVEQAGFWWNQSVSNGKGGYGAWQYQVKTWWLNLGGYVYSQSLSGITTSL